MALTRLFFCLRFFNFLSFLNARKSLERGARVNVKTRTNDSVYKMNFGFGVKWSIPMASFTI